MTNRELILTPQNEYQLTITRGDQREAHDSGNSVSLDALKDFGVTYRQVPVDDDGKWENEIGESLSYLMQCQSERD